MHDIKMYESLSKVKHQYFSLAKVVTMPSIDSNDLKQFKISVLEFIRNKL